MSNVIAGGLASVKSQATIVIFINPNGTDQDTGLQVLTGSLADIKSQCTIALVVDENGNAQG